MMNSAIYQGTLMHRRFVPKDHQFIYRLKMILLDLDEIESFLAKSRLWVKERFGLVSFRRMDYLPDDSLTVKEAVLNTVEKETGVRPEGPVFMLSNLRYLGMQFNPASFFYCFGRNGETLTHVLIEVHNTPWNERHRYVLPIQESGKNEIGFKKEFHVSPFNPMDMVYSSRFAFSKKHISTQLENHKNNTLHFKASLNLKREELTGKAMSSFARRAWKLPLLIVMGIYWQAFKLFLKRAPYYQYSKR
jgi:uncharacterized protein